MEVITNKQEKVISNILLKPGYYITTRRKIADFFLGFFGFAVLSWVCQLLSLYLFNKLVVYVLPNWITYAYSGLVISVILSLIIYFFKIGRKYIAIGIISLYLLPLLVVGGCLLLLGNGSIR
jgi:hypothetical protein